MMNLQFTTIKNYSTTFHTELKSEINCRLNDIVEEMKGIADKSEINISYQMNLLLVAVNNVHISNMIRRLYSFNNIYDIYEHCIDVEDDLNFIHKKVKKLTNLSTKKLIQRNIETVMRNKNITS